LVLPAATRTHTHTHTRTHTHTNTHTHTHSHTPPPTHPCGTRTKGCPACNRAVSARTARHRNQLVLQYSNRTPANPERHVIIIISIIIIIIIIMHHTTTWAPQTSNTSNTQQHKQGGKALHIRFKTHPALLLHVLSRGHMEHLTVHDNVKLIRRRRRRTRCIAAGDGGVDAHVAQLHARDGKRGAVGHLGGARVDAAGAEVSEVAQVKLVPGRGGECWQLFDAEKRF